MSTSGMILRTHPDDGMAGGVAARIALLRADQITMDDGVVIRDWPPLVADVREPGLNGLDEGEVAGNSWYDTYAVRNSTTGVRGLILHRRKLYQIDQQQGSGVSVAALRSSIANQKLAQSFTPSLSGKLEVLDVPLRKSGTPSGFVWFTVEADNAGAPSGTALATSDRIMAGGFPAGSIPDFNVRAVFRAPATLAATSVYWLVLHGDYAINGSNFAEWYCGAGNVYSGGAPAAFNGVWSASANDFTFKTYSTQFESPVVMPSGFDQKRLVAFFFTSAYFDPMEWRDRRCYWLIRSSGTGFGDFTATIPVVRDSHLIFPHGLPVEVDVVVSKHTTGYVMVGGVPEGYSRQANQWDGTVTGYVSIGTQSVYSGTVASDFGALYVNVDSGAGFVFTPTWRW